VKSLTRSEKQRERRTRRLQLAADQHHNDRYADIVVRAIGDGTAIVCPKESGQVSYSVVSDNIARMIAEMLCGRRDIDAHDCVWVCHPETVPQLWFVVGHGRRDRLQILSSDVYVSDSMPRLGEVGAMAFVYAIVEWGPVCRQTVPLWLDREHSREIVGTRCVVLGRTDS